MGGGRGVASAVAARHSCSVHRRARGLAGMLLATIAPANLCHAACFSSGTPPAPHVRPSSAPAPQDDMEELINDKDEELGPEDLEAGQAAAAYR